MEIPPLPVSNTKFKLSLKSSNVARTIIIPPVNWVNGIVVMNFAGGGTNSSCAKSEVVMKKKILKDKILDKQFKQLWRGNLKNEFLYPCMLVNSAI